MGVAPEWQGKGLGTALMQPGLDEIDAASLPAYLESSTPRSRALYGRNGFEVTGELEPAAGGPPLWLMWRDPRPRARRLVSGPTDRRWRHGREVVQRRGAGRDVAADDGARDRGDRRAATSSRRRRLCEAMKHESQFMHDLLVDGIAGLISFVKERLGDEGVRGGVERLARAQLAQAGREDRREPTARRSPQALAATWRAHSDQRRRPAARARSRSPRTTRSSPSR